ncbi:hypothetical protein B0H65DRAFT_523978 [Neurospora tetraspora]|uniref:Uncharacterized protein n=1 Tax=Neurospora tetraspora TaxID=94610 RepID=A0AAE0MRL7_9PEZI|nr:hypothetical protein B0H65DRAFT_523978 [Neurospora tetraspora]
MSSPARPNSPTLPPPPGPPPSSPLPLLPPFRLPSGTAKPTATDTARQQGALLGLLSCVCRVTETLYQDFRFLERRFGGDPVRAPKQQLEERRKRVRRVWKTVENYPGLALEGEVVRLCERMFGDVLRGEFPSDGGIAPPMLTTIFPLVYHPFINNGESTTTFMVPWGEYLGTFTGTISDVEEEVDKAVKKLTAKDRKTSGTGGGGDAGTGVRIESLMRPV